MLSKKKERKSCTKGKFSDICICRLPRSGDRVSPWNCWSMARWRHYLVVRSKDSPPDCCRSCVSLRNCWPPHADSEDDAHLSTGQRQADSARWLFRSPAQVCTFGSGLLECVDPQVRGDSSRQDDVRKAAGEVTSALLSLASALAREQLCHLSGTGTRLVPRTSCEAAHERYK